MVGHLGNSAEIDVPKDYLFADGDNTRKFMEMNQNPTDGDEVGLITPSSEQENWFVLFEYDTVGYVKDDDRSSLDADAILKSIQDGTEQANKTRKEKGWAPFHINSWNTRPFYDQANNNLTWAVNGSEDNGANANVNYSVRLLGRRGIMRVDLVIDPKDVSRVIPIFNSVMRGFRFSQGNRYADFAQGDKLAGYGLTALIAGGAGAIAAKTGLLAKLWKFIVIAFAAIAAFFKRMWNRLFGKKPEFPSAQPASPPPPENPALNSSNPPGSSGSNDHAAG
jgi:uncharacterized membrane-anchored protein